MRRNFISTMTKKHAGVQEFEDITLGQRLISFNRGTERASVDNCRIVDDQLKRVKRKKKTSKEPRNIGT